MWNKRGTLTGIKVIVVAATDDYESNSVHYITSSISGATLENERKIGCILRLKASYQLFITIFRLGFSPSPPDSPVSGLIDGMVTLLICYIRSDWNHTLGRIFGILLLGGGGLASAKPLLIKGCTLKSKTLLFLQDCCPNLRTPSILF